MNKQKYLDSLNNIDEVYDGQVNILEEVIYYHGMREKFEKIAGNENLEGDEEDSERSVETGEEKGADASKSVSSNESESRSDEQSENSDESEENK